MTVDGFGLDSMVLGDHAEEFYGAVGRVVCTFAVLESQIIALRHALARVQSGTYTQEPVSAQVKATRKMLAECPSDRTEHIEGFLREAEALLAKRNDIVHSSWPAQGEGQLFGHRQVRKTPDGAGTTKIVVMNLDDLRGLIRQVSQLVGRFNGVFAVAQGLSISDQAR